MPYFESKDRTVFSPQVEKLEPFYKFLERHHKTMGGSLMFDELVETYEYLDFTLNKKEQGK
jgi:hypothetical protein